MELSKNKLNIYSSLGNSKMRKKYALFTVEGEKSVKDTLNSFDIEAIIYLEGKLPDFIDNTLPSYEVSDSVMRKISNLNTYSNIIAVFKYPHVEKRIPSQLNTGLFIVLDGVQDPGNLGTIIRTCHWFGIDTVFASKDTVDIFNPKTVQSTMGSISKVDIIYCNLSDLFKNNPEMPVYGLLLDGKNIFTRKLHDKGFILMGNEGKGISNDLRKYITDPLFIPPGKEDHSESLNVSVATGITLAMFKR